MIQNLSLNEQSMPLPSLDSTSDDQENHQLSSTEDVSSSVSMDENNSNSARTLSSSMITRESKIRNADTTRSS